MDNEILIDTNIIRRLMEGNVKMTDSMSTIKNKGFHFRVSDMTLFELVDSIKTTKDYYQLLNVLYDYEILPIFKVVISEFGDQYCEWFKKPISIIELKAQLLPSFSMTLAIILTDLANAIMLFLANKLTKDYSSYFYNSILGIISETNTDHFKNVILQSYLTNNIKLNKRLPLEFRDLVIRELTYYNLLQKYEEFDKDKFIEEFSRQNEIHKGKSFKDICAEILTEQDMLFNLNDIEEKNDAIFRSNFIKDVLYKRGRFQINDITDYINFKYAMQYCEFYFTTDYRSLRNYERYFSADKSIQDYIRRSKEFIQKEFEE